MQDRIDKGRKGKDVNVKEAVRMGARMTGKDVFKASANEKDFQNKPQWNPCVKVTDQLNSYTGPMMVGKQIAPPVKQFKTILGGTIIKSASFLEHGKNVITTTSLTKAATDAKRNAR